MHLDLNLENIPVGPSGLNIWIFPLWLAAQRKWPTRMTPLAPISASRLWPVGSLDQIQDMERTSYQDIILSCQGCLSWLSPLNEAAWLQASILHLLLFLPVSVATTLFSFTHYLGLVIAPQLLLALDYSTTLWGDSIFYLPI